MKTVVVAGTDTYHNKECSMLIFEVSKNLNHSGLPPKYTYNKRLDESTRKYLNLKNCIIKRNEKSKIAKGGELINLSRGVHRLLCCKHVLLEQLDGHITSSNFAYSLIYSGFSVKWKSQENAEPVLRPSEGCTH